MRVLIIQTAFIGDVILATPLVEKLHRFYPEAVIDVLVRKGNESLLVNHPKIKEIITWNKKINKLRNLLRIIISVRKKKYDYVINAHRFASSGIVTVLSGAKTTIGFDKNPFSFFFSKKYKHIINVNGTQHEVDRNLSLIESITDSSPEKPKLYPSQLDEQEVSIYKSNPFGCIAPASVWFTKQFPREQWINLIALLLDGKWKKISNDHRNLKIYLVGGKEDFELCESIKKKLGGNAVINLAGKLSLLQTSALMRDAVMNFVNDSAPLHLCSAMNANVTAVFCSTVPAFGFGPLSDNHFIIELKQPLYCRPCGLHGYNICPEGHFRCALDIDIASFASNSKGYA